MSRESRAIRLLREVRDEAASRQRHFGNVNDMNFEPGVATDAARQVAAIDAFLAAAPAPEPAAVQELKRQLLLRDLEIVGLRDSADAIALGNVIAVQELVAALTRIINRCNSFAEADDKGLLLSIKEEASSAIAKAVQS